LCRWGRRFGCRSEIGFHRGSLGHSRVLGLRHCVIVSQVPLHALEVSCAGRCLSIAGPWRRRGCGENLFETGEVLRGLKGPLDPWEVEAPALRRRFGLLEFGFDDGHRPVGDSSQPLRLPSVVSWRPIVLGLGGESLGCRDRNLEGRYPKLAGSSLSTASRAVSPSSSTARAIAWRWSSE
jgi:hypothetical protein